MRCGICGKDGKDGTRSYPYDLNAHKRNVHPAEYWAAIESRRTKMQATKATKAVEAQRVSAARLAASRPVVIRYSSKEAPITCPSSQVRRFELNRSRWHGELMTDVRFPEAEAYQRYMNVMGVFAALEAKAREHLTDAWERGTPVTLEHLDELDRAAMKSEER